MRRLRAAVPLVGESGETVILRPGDEVPAWAWSQIRNPRAWEEVPDPEPAPAPAQETPAPAVPVVVPTVEDTPAPEPDPVPADDGSDEASDGGTEPDGPDYQAMTKTQLLAIIAERNDAGESIPKDGNKADLIDALEAADQGGEGAE